MLNRHASSRRWVWSAVLTLALACPAATRAKEPGPTVDAATTVLKEFLDLQVKGIPASLLAQSHGVAIVPGVIKVGLVLGGQRGKGVVVIREKDGSWRAPMFITLTGGSIGWQAGAQSTDVVLVFKTQKSVEGLLSGKFTIGADAAAAAGPIGRRAAASTDGDLQAEIYSYSRTRGLFAGISLDGSVLEVDDGMNAAYYGAVAPGEPAPAPPQAAIELAQLIAQVTANPELIEGQPARQAIAGEPTPAGPMLVPAGPTIVRSEPAVSLDPSGAIAAQPASDRDALQDELARSSRQLHALIDRSWQRYLQLPDEVYGRGKRPAAKEVQTAANRYEAVLGDPRYQALTERPEFQATRDLLVAYLEALTAADAPKLALPPPPAGPR